MSFRGLASEENCAPPPPLLGEKFNRRRQAGRIGKWEGDEGPHTVPLSTQEIEGRTKVLPKRFFSY